jgi:hypothetical protein
MERNRPNISSAPTRAVTETTMASPLSNTYKAIHRPKMRKIRKSYGHTPIGAVLGCEYASELGVWQNGS